MDLKAIREFFMQNKDNEDVKVILTELKGKPSLADIQQLVLEDNEIKIWFQSEKDRHFTKGLETWKAKTFPQLLEDEIKKRYPEESEEQRQLRELRAEIDKERRERLRESLKNKAKDLAIEKKLPPNLVDFFIGENEESTFSNLSKLEEIWNQSLQTVVNETFKQNGREPHKTMSAQYSGKNPWKAETFNLTEQARIWKEDPQLAKKLQEQAK